MRAHGAEAVGARRGQRSAMATVLRWTARALSVGVLGVVLAFAFGEGTPRPAEWVLLALFPIGLLAGLLVSWWREIPGALLSQGSMGAFYVACLVKSGHFPGGPYFAVLTAPAVVFLLAGLARRGDERA